MPLDQLFRSLMPAELRDLVKHTHAPIMVAAAARVQLYYF